MAYVAETVSQVVSAECTSKCESDIDFNESDGRIEYQAASICQQRRALSHADLQALLKPTTEAIVAEVTPKVATVSLCEDHYCNASCSACPKGLNLFCTPYALECDGSAEMRIVILHFCEHEVRQ